MHSSTSIPSGPPVARSGITSRSVTGLRLLCGILSLALPLALAPWGAFAQRAPDPPPAPWQNQVDVRRDHGALCNDAADDLPAFERAVGAARAAGGATIVVPGICRVSGTIQVNASNITFQGLGNQVSMIRTTSATAPIVVFGDGITQYHSNYVDNVGFATAVARTAGAAVRFVKVGQGGYFRGYAADQFRGVEIAGGSGIIRVDGSRFVSPGASTGSAIHIDDAIEAQLSNITIAGRQEAQPYAGIHVVKAGGLRLENVDAVWCGTGLALVPSPGSTIEHVFSSRNSWDSGAGHGILLQAAAGTTIRRATFIGDWTASNARSGIATAGPGTIEGIEFIGHRSLANGRHGALFASGTDLAIAGGMFSGNSTQAAAVHDGVRFEAIGGFRVSGARSGAATGFGKTQRYGISVGGPSSDDYVLSGNDVRGNATAGLALARSLAATRIVRDNSGHTTENAGTVRGWTPDGAGDITVEHGLAGLPTRVFVQFSGTAAFVLSTHSYGPVSFKVRIFDAAGGAMKPPPAGTISWRAEQ